MTTDVVRGRRPAESAFEDYSASLVIRLWGYLQIAWIVSMDWRNMFNTLDVWTDGSITGGAWGPKKGPATTPHGWSGWVVKRPDGVVVQYHSIDLGAADYMSGNVAEYMGLRSALAWLHENHPLFNLNIYADSQLLINQMSGAWHCYDEGLLMLRDECRKLAGTFPRVTFNWIRREFNKEADVLSKGYQIWDRVPTWPEVQEYLTKGKS